MSDGPHRSLNMRPWWKEAARRADRSAFDVTECAEAIRVAMSRECKDELRPSFMKALRDAQEEPGLFSPAESSHLLRLVPATPLERCVLDNITALSSEDKADANALLNGFANALTDHLARNNRSTEEHYRRLSGAGHANRERQRLDEASALADMAALAQQLLRPNGVRTHPALTKKTGIEDGVKLK
jgi:hypothetical protein